jgi:para-nitrobenzyl esterase
MNPRHRFPFKVLRRNLLRSLPSVGLLACALAANPCAAADSGPVVSVTGGSIQGRLLPEDRGAVFRGVPFAQPPIGNLRWREPMPVIPWQGVREAVEPGAPAMQPALGWNDSAAAICSEDCLYLDVWAPKAAARLPVMVWIHGGANVAGAGGFDPLFDGKALISHGVILVVVEYRLGVFGFLAHPELTRESPHHASGNYGILDQVAALQWVHDNIAAFGGDAGNVTIFGQSAGAMDILALMATPLSKGLFQRALSESGPLQKTTASLAEAEQAGATAVGKLGTRDLASLRSVPANDLLKTVTGVSGFTTDGWVFPVAPFDAWKAGREHAVPVIIGSNAVEFPFGGTSEELAKSISDFFGDLAPRALALYGLDGGGKPLADDPLYGNAADQWGSDLFRCLPVILGEWHAASGSPAWEYEFDRAIPPKPRTAHSAELPYVFANQMEAGNKWGGEFQEADHALSAVIQGYWTNFAKTGNPNGPGLPAWDRHDAAARKYIAFTTKAEVVQRENERGPASDLFREALSAPAPSPGAVGSQSVPASDPHFAYDGRFDFSDPASPAVIWEASTVGIDFTGDRLAVKFKGVTGQVFFNAAVDGASSVLALKEGAPEGTFPLAVKGPGPHHLVLFKRTEASAGTARFTGIEIAPGAQVSTPAAPFYRMKMEIYGDSITAGACDEDGDKDQWEDRSTHNAARSWAALTAAEFSADYRNISISGIGLAAGYDDVLMGQVWDRTYPEASSPRADLGKWTPDVVLVLLGDNDDSYPRSKGLPFPSNFQESYAALIHAIRGAYPRAHIVLMNGAMWAGTNSRELGAAWGSVVKRLESMDPAISNFTFVHWTMNHPRASDHRILADELDAWLGRQAFMGPPAR